MSFPWSTGEKVNASDFNEIATGAAQKVTLGETIDGSPVPKAVYLKSSDSKVYKTDAAALDEKVLSYVGFMVEDGNANDTKILKMEGVVDGLSGLTAGTEYSLAKAGTSQADITGGDSGPAGNSNNIGDANKRYARGFTTTAKGKLIDVQLRLRKQGSPSGNLVCEIRSGTPSGSNADGGGILVASKSVAASGISTSYATVTFTFSSPIILPAGTYYVSWYHDTGSVGNNFQVEATTTSTTAYAWPETSWGNNAADALYTLNFSTATFAAGEITDYFFDYKKTVGTAISATEIRLLDRRSVVAYISKSPETTYTAECDGLVIGTIATTDVNDKITGYRNGSIVSDGARCAVIPVQRGDAYRLVRSDTGNTATINFVPIN